MQYDVPRMYTIVDMQRTEKRLNALHAGVSVFAKRLLVVLSTALVAL